MRTVAAVLAAGGGSRFAGDGHKLLADLDGRPVHRHAIDAAIAAAIGPVVVVSGAVALDLPANVHHVLNTQWESGQASSLQCAIAAATVLDADAVVIGLADQPFVPAEAWRAVAGAPAECAIVVATYDGVRGPNPVRLARSLWPLLPREGDEGARTVIRENAERVCEVPCSGSPADIDTLEDLRRWTSS